jgi:hypothetical protein
MDVDGIYERTGLYENIVDDLSFLISRYREFAT